MKRVISLLAAGLVFVLALSGCSQAGRRTAAMKFLNADISGFYQTARQVAESGQVPQGVLFDGVERVAYHPGSGQPWVAFITGSNDEPGPDYIEVGFYYTADDQPMGWQDFIPRPALVQDGFDTSKYTWSGPGGDITYYTEFMQTNWYYYELHGGWVEE